MEKLQFTATEIEIDADENDILIVGFYSEEHYVTVQLTRGPAFDELPPFMQTYHIERDDQSFGNYGGIKEVILSNSQIQFIPNEKGREFLQVSDIVVDFELDDLRFLELKVSIITIFEDAFRLV